MSAQAFEVVEMDMDISPDTSENYYESFKKGNAASARLQRRRRIEEINEQRLMRDEWDEL
jgi:hypothetical protein